MKLGYEDIEFLQDFHSAAFNAKWHGAHHYFNKTEIGRIAGFADIALEIASSGKDPREYLTDIMVRCQWDFDKNNDHEVVTDAKESMHDATRRMLEMMPDGREKSLFITKVQEAMFFGAKAMEEQGDLV